MITEKLQQIIGSAPQDLVDYLSHGHFLNAPEQGIHCLNVADSLEQSEAFNSFGVGSELGVWVLDDANDSNPHCYLSKGPCKGAVLKLCHDDEAQIVFSSLASFVNAMSNACANGIPIDDVVQENTPSFDCLEALHALVLQDTDEAIALIDIYLKVTPVLDEALIDKLLRHVDFFVQASLAHWLLTHPHRAYLDVVQRLSAHPVDQVQSVGRECLRQYDLSAL